MDFNMRERARKLGEDFNRLYHRRFLTRSYNTDGVDIVGADWDTLILLDGCRFDLFRERNTFPGTLEKRESRASATLEFLEANVAEKKLHDTVYVTATPQFHTYRHELGTEFHAVINLWNKEEALWNGQTTLPGPVTDAAIQAAEKFPQKRLLVHYIQPHHPFIPHEGPLPKDGSMWKDLKRGDIEVSTETLWTAYGENLEFALPEVKRLMDAVEGRTVVTSDHGNMLGERTYPVPLRIWGHPHSIYDSRLVTVPWLVNTSGERREISAEKPTETYSEDITDDSVEDHLAALGYR